MLTLASQSGSRQGSLRGQIGDFEERSFSIKFLFLKGEISLLRGQNEGDEICFKRM